uniref:Glycoprotein hormone subunit beta domain-containing protein n=2 Tax=Esox lucius TaxID=8010 RepID=A0A3P8Z8L8_ESOLU
MYCTQLRTLLLVVTAMLWLTPVGAGPDCMYSCRLQNMTFPLEREDCRGSVIIPTCAGLCKTEDLNYYSKRIPHAQGVCNFKDWSYEEVYLESCPPGADPFLIPVAKSCDCSKCKMDSTDCNRMSTATSYSCQQHFPLEM